MDKRASGLLLLAFGLILILWWYRTDRMVREAVFQRLTEGTV
jgi:hypothetical protein